MNAGGLLMQILTIKERRQQACANYLLHWGCMAQPHQKRGTTLYHFIFKTEQNFGFLILTLTFLSFLNLVFILV